MIEQEPATGLGLTGASLASELKERTRDAHTRAERHPIQGRMVRGTVSRAEYAAYLGQLLHLWNAIDDGVAKAAARDARVAAMVREYHPHAWRVRADLRFYGRNGDMQAIAATAKMVEMIGKAAETPGVVGAWYVLEGSANGGRYIAKALAGAFQLEGRDGLLTMDPHGEAQRERWQAWREALDAQAFSESERAGILAAANAAFDGMGEMMEGLEKGQ